MASDSRSPAVPAGGPSPASPGARRGAPRRASGPGSGAESPSSRDTGRGRKGGRPLARHAPHVRGAPGAKPFVDDLLLGRGFVRSRAAPSLRSIESQPSTQGFVAPAGRPAGAAPAVAVEARATAPSLFSLRGPRLSVGGRRCVLGPGPGLGGVPSGGRGGPPSSAGRRGGGSRGRREGRPWRRLPASGRRALLRFPAAGPRPRAGPGDGREAWRGRGSGGVAGRPRRPLSLGGGGRAGPGGRRRAPVAAVTRVRARVSSLCPRSVGGGRKARGRRRGPCALPFFPGRYGSTSRPGGTWPPEGGRGRSTSRPGGTWPPERGRGRSTSPPFRAWCPSGQLCGRCVLRARVGLAGPSRQTDPLSDVCIFFSDVSSWLLEVCV